MKEQPKEQPKQEKSDLMDQIGRFFDDPYGFVIFTFDWGHGSLENQPGPDEWQTEVLKKIGEGCLGKDEPLQLAVASGTEVGKTALVAWLILWFISTRTHPQIVVTANTSTQLETKTWRELAKWHKLAINTEWFTWTATKFYLKKHPETWFAAAIPWSKDRPEAFRGTHEKYVLMIFDEGSSIDDGIYGVADTAISKPEHMWLVFGNPTRNVGRFKECWGKNRHRWVTYQVDARKSKVSDKNKIKKWIEDYGEDSDYVRINVKGEFPRMSATQFISEEIVDGAMKREQVFDAYRFGNICMGVDVARQGDDQSVVLIRQGLKIHSIKRLRINDTMQLAGYISGEINSWNPSAVFVDAIGIGAGVIDRLRQLGFNPIEVNNSNTAIDDTQYHNLRVESWAKMRDWLKIGYLPNDRELKSDLIGPDYFFDAKNRWQLEAKEDMKSRGLASPDSGDALAMTFALPSAVVAWNKYRNPMSSEQQRKAISAIV